MIRITLTIWIALAASIAWGAELTQDKAFSMLEEAVSNGPEKLKDFCEKDPLCVTMAVKWPPGHSLLNVETRPYVLQGEAIKVPRRAPDKPAGKVPVIAIYKASTSNSEVRTDVEFIVLPRNVEVTKLGVVDQDVAVELKSEDGRTFKTRANPNRLSAWVHSTATTFGAKTERDLWWVLSGMCSTPVTFGDTVRIGSLKQIRGASFTSDGKRLAILHDRGVMVIDREAGKMQYEVAFGKQFSIYKGSMAFDGSGRFFAVCFGQGDLFVYDASDGSKIAEHDTRGAAATGLAWLPGSERLVTGHNGGTLNLVDTKTGKVSRSQQGSRNRIMWGDPEPVLVTPDGRLALTVVKSYKTKKVMAWAWDLGTPEVLPREIGPERDMKATAVGISADSKTILVGWEDGRIEAFDAATLKSIRVLEEGVGKPVGYGWIDSFHSLKDGKTILVGVPKGYALYDLAGGAKLKMVETKPQPMRNSVAYDPVTKTLAILQSFSVNLQLVEAD